MRFVVRVWLLVALLTAVGGHVACGDDEKSGETTDTATEKPREKAEFSYSGDTGPENWGSLDPLWKECSDGKRQSPIDLSEDERADLARIEFAYTTVEVEAENNGHSVEVGIPEGSSITIDGRRSELQQFHFHAPSEHTLGGRRFPLELHFVHLDADENPTVLGVLVDEGSEDNEAFRELVKAIPKQKGETARVSGDVDALALLPDDAPTGPRWSYDGSLTTPPCAEGVSWNVFSEPVELSRKQIDAYEAAFDDNSRPVQPLNGRELLVSR